MFIRIKFSCMPHFVFHLLHNSLKNLNNHISGLLSNVSFTDKTPVSEIPSNLPQWKQDLLRKKRKEKMVGLQAKSFILQYINCQGKHGT